METKFTPGPWFADRYTKTVLSKTSGETVAFAASLTRRIDETILNGESWLAMRERTAPEREACEIEENANRKLIASAPDLLDALKMVIEEFAPKYHDCIDSGLPKCGWCYAFEAIKKATE